jgi:hypothetical protein
MPVQPPPQEPQLQLVDKVTVDSHEGANGVIEIVEKHTEVVNCVPEHAAVQSIPAPPQPPSVVEGQPEVPKLFDMDLERMHVELHKNRYLTPQDFLNDVGKMVHNAVVCQSEDLERLHRAQAMYTATEVSMQDFDPQFRAECERMAERERQRRAVRKKEKEKAKEKEKGPDAESETYAPGTRRSARHNGQEPEIAITDVTKLERAARLKRQRSTGPSTGSQASGDEISDGRNAKRSRVNSEDVPMDANIPESCNSLQVSSVYLSCPQPQQTPDSADTNGDGGLLPDVPLSAMGGGFDPSLLNPAPPQEPYLRFFTPSSASVGAPSDPPDSMTVDAQPPHSPSPALPPESAPNSELLPTSEPLVSNTDVPSTPIPPIASESPAPAPPAPEHDFEAIEIDREPTPLPEFHFDQNALTRLGDDLRDTTDLFSVEQLEQLRASCLGCIWAHRSDWDRNNLILELGKVLSDFVDEVRVDHEDEAMATP